jgi:hypothetical protein
MDARTEHVQRARFTYRKISAGPNPGRRGDRADGFNPECQRVALAFRNVLPLQNAELPSDNHHSHIINEGFYSRNRNSMQLNY